MSVGKIIARGFEGVLVLWMLNDALALYFADKPAAAIRNAILALAVVTLVEALLWLTATRSWSQRAVSSDEVSIRVIQLIIVVAMIADSAAWLLSGEGFGVHQPGCLLAVVILEGVIRRFVRPDPRPPAMAQALNALEGQVKVFTHLPHEKVRETLGMVRGISDIEASSRLDFELAEREALYSMLKAALELGANAVVDARLTTGTYETNGSQWQVSRPVYTGTAVRI
jgi:uncharacterized protein YbjQ (UPF0145 family)